MKKKTRIAAVLLVGMLAAVGITGCDQRQSDDVSYNLSLEADNFNDVRQITVINCLQGEVLFQMTGKMAIEADTSDGQLEIIVEDENGDKEIQEYKIDDLLMRKKKPQGCQGCSKGCNNKNQGCNKGHGKRKN